MTNKYKMVGATGFESVYGIFTKLYNVVFPLIILDYFKSHLIWNGFIFMLFYKNLSKKVSKKFKRNLIWVVELYLSFINNYRGAIWGIEKRILN